MGDHTTPTTVRIGSGVLQSIAAQAIACAPVEACGLLIGQGPTPGFVVRRAAPSTNVTADDPATTYQIEPGLVVELLLQARRDGERLLGFYHSHPRGPTEPSPRDHTCAWRDKVYLIVDAAGGKVARSRCWRLPAGESEFIEDRLVVVPPTNGP